MKLERMMNKKIVFFNGPPRSGKDTIVNELLKKYDSTENIKFSNPLKTALPVFFGLSKEQIDVLENEKEVYKDYLLGKTWRDAQISLSEEWAKKVFGSRVFGNITKNIIKNSSSQLFLISDSGFQEEAGSLVEHFGKDSCLLIRIKRDGTNFNNDSRSYWKNIYDIDDIVLYNDKSIEAVVDKANEIINNWIARKYKQ
jgi:hypothetical protein